MKWAITGDLQFAEQTRLSTLTDTGITSRLRDQVECFKWVQDAAREEGCDGLIVLGDVFDSRTKIPVPVLDSVGYCFQRARGMFGVNVHIVVGNHDTFLRTSSIHSLKTLSGLALIHDRPSVVGSLAFVPWVEDIKGFREAVRSVIGQGASFLFSHVLLMGAVDGDDCVGRSVKDVLPDEWDWVFLGDVHDPIEIANNVQYAGAPMQHHYGDAGGDRGFWILDEEDGQVEFRRNTLSPRFHVVDDPDSIEGIREGDFVRAKTDERDVAQAIVEKAGSVTSNVEVLSASLFEEDLPRLDVSARQPYREVLEKYLTHQDASDMPGLLDLGLELLEEASA